MKTSKPNQSSVDNVLEIKVYEEIVVTDVFGPGFINIFKTRQPLLVDFFHIQFQPFPKNVFASFSLFARPPTKAGKFTFRQHTIFGCAFSL